MTDGICPFAIWRPVGSFGYPQGAHGGNRPMVFVDHVMGGWKHTLDTPGWQESAGVSVHAGIGTDGSLSQYVNIFDSAWGNGLVGQSPRGDMRGVNLYNRANPLLHAIEMEAGANWHNVETHNGPKWTLSIGVQNAWNCRSISIEHEGIDGNVPWTPAMIDTDVAWKEWCNSELARLAMSPIPTSNVGIIGHFDIDHIDRAGCPGAGRPLDAIIARLQGDAEVDEVWKTEGNFKVLYNGPNLPVRRYGSTDGLHQGRESVLLGENYWWIRYFDSAGVMVAPYLSMTEGD